MQVQPWSSLEKLEKLEKSMQQFYSSDSARKPVTKKDLEQDCFFAAFSDNMWRRVRVNAMLDEFTVAVRLVDHGDFSMMNIDCLQLLCSSFRNLPMQAVNASLAGKGCSLQPMQKERRLLNGLCILSFHRYHPHQRRLVAFRHPQIQQEDRQPPVRQLDQRKTV